MLYVKARLEAKPSRVLHFRGVPLDVTDSEILQLSLPFGNVTNLVVSKKKNQVVTPKPTFLTSLLFTIMPLRTLPGVCDNLASSSAFHWSGVDCN